MANVTLPQRLREIVGASGQLQREHLERLKGIAEGDDFDVKSQTYGNSDKDKRELCADLQHSRMLGEGCFSSAQPQLMTTWSTSSPQPR
jgi:hypothetical protein